MRRKKRKTLTGSAVVVMYSWLPFFAAFCRFSVVIGAVTTPRRAMAVPKQRTRTSLPAEHATYATDASASLSREMVRHVFSPAASVSEMAAAASVNVAAARRTRRKMAGDSSPTVYAYQLSTETLYKFGALAKEKPAVRASVAMVPLQTRPVLHTHNHSSPLLSQLRTLVSPAPRLTEVPSANVDSVTGWTSEGLSLYETK